MNKEKLNDYPTLYISNVDNILNQPSLIITIGCPGSGKTTWAKERCNITESAHDIANEANKTKLNEYRKNYPLPVIAADDYFTMFNNDEYDVKLISKAHEWCRTQIFNKLMNGETVVVNNTNTQLQEMHDYVSYTIFSNLPHKIVFAVMPQLNADLLEKRNGHGVPAKKIKQMKGRFLRWYKKGQITNPPSISNVIKAGPLRYGKKQTNICKKYLYTGIFLDEQESQRLLHYFVS